MTYARIAQDMSAYAEVFHVTSATEALQDEFVRDHQARHGRRAGAIGGRYTVVFTPKAEGVYAGIRCSCGAAASSGPGMRGDSERKKRAAPEGPRLF